MLISEQEKFVGQEFMLDWKRMWESGVKDVKVVEESRTPCWDCALRDVEECPACEDVMYAGIK